MDCGGWAGFRRVNADGTLNGHLRLGPSLSRFNSDDSAGEHPAAPVLAHKFKHNKSILALAVSKDSIFGGTEEGEILVFNLETYKRTLVIDGHRGSVLGLCLSEDGKLLFSSSSDHVVNVWCTESFVRVYSIYSHYDIGDIFCVAYSTRLETVYIGAQNTSIQWYDLKQRDTRPKPLPTSHPWHRQSRFFDSPGPGGVRTPRKDVSGSGPGDARGGQVLEIDRQDIRQFAHNGYVYCMLLAKGLKGNPNQEVLISGGGDGTIKIWSLAESGGAIEELDILGDGREEGESVLSIALDGTFLFAGRADGEVNIWDLETKQLVRNLKTRTDDVLALSVGGGFIFCAGMSGTVEKYNAQYERVSDFKAHQGRVLASIFIPHKERPLFITGSNDQTISLWDISDCISGGRFVPKTSNERLVDALRQFVSYRTVSSDIRYQAECRRGAYFLRDLLKSFGATTTSLPLQNSSWNPIILAKFHGNPKTASKRKRILFYGHYDVIPAENESNRWNTDPFTLEGVNDHVYGRGVSDNKGPILAAIYAVADLVANKELDSDIVFLIEGEEETGSRGFEQAIRANKKLIGDIDWILLANSYWLDDHNPCLTYGLRGVIHATIEVQSGHPDLHSGVDGSSLLDESLKDLVALLSKLTGKHGRVLIPGFYDPILPITDDEAVLYEDIKKALVTSNPSLAFQHNLTEELQKRWCDASLTIHRFYTSGPDNSTIIPRLAKASISLRLVPNQTAQEVAQSLTSFLHEQFETLDSKNELTVNIDHMAEPWLGDYKNQIFKTLEEAVMEAWSTDAAGSPFIRRRSSNVLATMSPLDIMSSSAQTLGTARKPAPTTSSTLAKGSMTPEPSDSEPEQQGAAKQARKQSTTSFPAARRRKPLYIREGGSIPAIRFLEKEFNAPAAHLPCGQASDNAHLDNERLRLVNLYKSRDIFRKVFRDLPQK
ncbi:hypothetical protein, variant [Verruconis gallopava]|uniref:Uncharacterized protein n=1 Tax=Verruconis gallopava TaxID=253628 RepID=A0A0D1YUG4_9PEZI|nr:hypothetical protein, variant [Verruconis gallopava]KIW04317.1 hypothetical protein, variant [Verruconis gallopava]